MELSSKGLKKIDTVTVFGPQDAKKRTGVIPFKVQGMSAHAVAFALDEVAHIAIRSGLHCCHPLLKEVLNEPDGTARASVYFYNTPEEVDIFIQTLKDLTE